MNLGSPPELTTGDYDQKMWSVVVAVGTDDADFIESRNGLLKGPGLGRGHQFTRVAAVKVEDFQWMKGR